MKVLPSLLASSALADIYLHFPRGTNNRLNENNRNQGRANSKRLFDSQNGGTGGYNVGDVTAEPHTDYAGQNKAVYFQSGELAPSEISIEWFNQHGCGVADKNDANWINCQIVIQYMCQDSASTRIANGLNTETPAYTAPPDTEQFHNETIARRDADFAAKPDTGMHESWESYDACYRRERNRGLFMADKNPGRTKGATKTRQNSAGTRYGYECTEEKDYFPYWHPSEWTDIAVMTSEPTNCESIVNNSGNRVVKHECVHYIDEDTVTGWSKSNTKDLCEMNGGKWVGFQQFKEIIADRDEMECTQMIQKNRNVRWAVPYLPGAGRYIAPKEQCLMLHPEPECVVPPKMRANHNGNVEGGGLPTFKWDLPHYEVADFSKECALRIRYNITTNDYPGDFTTEQTETYYNSPEIWPNPVVNYKDVDLKLAINTAQFGRTFQDRSHVFQIVPRPASIPDDHKIYNVGVRGRRGNAAQTYPAVEYDFSPSNLEIESHDLVHFQWEGSNTVPTSTGQGADHTDRNNLVPMLVPNSNIPAGFIADQRQNDDLPVDHFSVTENGESKTYYVRSSHGATLAEIPDVCHSFGMSMPIPTSEAYNEALKNYWVNADGVWKGDFPVGVHANWVENDSGDDIKFNSFTGDFPKMEYYENVEHYAIMNAAGAWYDGRHENDFGWFPCVQQVYDVPTTDPEMFSEWLWSSSDVKDLTHMDDLKIQLASSGFYGCEKKGHCANSVEEPVEKMNAKLNNAPASFKGNVVKMNHGVHQFMCTRNNAFTNRHQKGTIIVH